MSHPSSPQWSAGIHLATVIPAVVGGDPSEEKRAWIPASAGMTVRELGMTERELGMMEKELGMAKREPGIAEKKWSLTEGTQKCGKGEAEKDTKTQKMEGRF